MKTTVENTQVEKTKHEKRLIEVNELIAKNPTNAKYYVTRSQINLEHVGWKSPNLNNIRADLRKAHEFEDDILKRTHLLLSLQVHVKWLYFYENGVIEERLRVLGEMIENLSGPDDENQLKRRLCERGSLYYLIMSRMKEDKYGELAFLDFNFVLEMDSEYEEAHCGLADLHWRCGNSKLASFEYLKVITTINPDNVRCLSGMGELSKAKEDYELAITYLTLAILASKDDLNSEGNAYHARGGVYLKMKEFKNCVKDFTKAIELNPYHRGALMDRSYAYLQMKDYNSAYDGCTLALKLLENAIGYERRGLVCTLAEKYSDAVRDLSRSIELEPKIATYQRRGFCYLMSEMFEQSILDYSKCIQILDEQIAGGGNVLLQIGVLLNYAECQEMRKVVVDLLKKKIMRM